MDKVTILGKLKNMVGSIGWKLFIWGNSTTEEEYWESIYWQEHYHRKESEFKEEED